VIAGVLTSEMMTYRITSIVVTLLLMSLALAGQTPYPRARRGLATTTPVPATAPKGVLVVFHGKLKVIDKKKIVIETDENQQLLTIRLTGKTKFLKDGKEVKPTTIDLETPLTVDASQDTDASLLAANVSVDSADKPAPDKTTTEKSNLKPN